MFTCLLVRQLEVEGEPGVERKGGWTVVQGWLSLYHYPQVKDSEESDSKFELGLAGGSEGMCQDWIIEHIFFNNL